MDAYVLEIRKILESMAEDSYREFSSSLIPGCENMLGIRVPKLRLLAKQIVKESPYEYLAFPKEIYYEEIMLKCLIVGALKDDIEVILKQAKQLIPKINCWALCDSFCSAFQPAKKYKERVWNFLIPYWKSEHTYDVRVAVVLTMQNYMDQEHLPLLFAYYNEVCRPDYYIQMAIAWAVSVCFIKFPEETMLFLKDNKLDDFTFNKALQKIRESLRVSTEMKEKLKAMKR